jgi:hypothetical protein
VRSVRQQCRLSTMTFALMQLSIRHRREWKSYRGTQIWGSIASHSREAGPYAISSQRTEARSAHQLRRSPFKEWNQTNFNGQLDDEDSSEIFFVNFVPVV